MAENDLKKWSSGASGKDVREAIEYNFNILKQRLDNRTYQKTFTISDWKDGVIFIDYYEHRILTPSPHVMILQDGKYVDVYGGYYIDDKDCVYLQSDIPFDGKVVIK